MHRNFNYPKRFAVIEQSSPILETFSNKYVNKIAFIKGILDSAAIKLAKSSSDLLYYRCHFKNRPGVFEERSGKPRKV